MSTPDVVGRATVARLMREIEDEVRRQRQARALARGGPDDYRDETLFATVESVLGRAVDRSNPDALLLPQLIDADEAWDLQLPLKFESHRKLLGPVIIFVKKRLLLPLTHWLYEYSLENFRRQQRINRLLFAAVEELALENARLRAIFGIAGLQDCRIEEGQERRGEGAGTSGKAGTAGTAGTANELGREDDITEGDKTEGDQGSADDGGAGGDA